jgi:hypothetical protein
MRCGDKKRARCTKHLARFLLSSIRWHLISVTLLAHRPRHVRGFWQIGLSQLDGSSK